ncbi:MAG TPA: hypothetical protein DHV25_02615 [Candidatus Kerfeldbacteria bacterium]|nr:hypothetical protein [Candidatus Kerfeldbacteria bacterium]
MSEKLAEVERVTVSSFAGGQYRGPCIQLDIGQSYAELEEKHVKKLRNVLNKWLDKQNKYRQKKKEIKE